MISLILGSKLGYMCLRKLTILWTCICIHFVKNMCNALPDHDDMNVISVDWGGGSLPLYSLGLEVGRLVNKAYYCWWYPQHMTLTCNSCSWLCWRKNSWTWQHIWTGPCRAKFYANGHYRCPFCWSISHRCQEYYLWREVIRKWCFLAMNKCEQPIGHVAFYPNGLFHLSNLAVPCWSCPLYLPLLLRISPYLLQKI